MEGAVACGAIVHFTRCREPLARATSPFKESSLDMLRKLLSFASVVETATGLALIVDPRLVVALLLGADVSGVGIPVGRCFGIALLALGVACWPHRQLAASGSPAFRAMLVYNAMIALFLIYLFAVWHLGGVLLWPGFALLAAVAALLIWAWHLERHANAADTRAPRGTPARCSLVLRAR